jgi:hypothetical protein
MFLMMLDDSMHPSSQTANEALVVVEWRARRV